MAQIRIPALYMRGGSSKGVFILARDLPADPHRRDALLLRVIGSPDRYATHVDGMGGATSSTSKVVIVSPSRRPGCDVDYLFGQVAVGDPIVDWSGNCGNLTTAVAPFAIARGLVAAPRDGIATVRLWQENISREILAHVPVHDGEVVEEGDFELDGVAFPAAEIGLEFLDPAGGGTSGAVFPTGRPIDRLEVPGVGPIEATLIDAGGPTVFVDAAALGLTGTERRADVDADESLTARAEAIRAHAAVVMGLGTDAAAVTLSRPHSPKLAFVAAPVDTVASDGRAIPAGSIDLLARTFSMGRLHHAMTGTGAVAIAAAAAIPGTVVSRLSGLRADGRIRFGHPAGTLAVGAEVERRGEGWVVARVRLSRSARRLMDGFVFVPDPDPDALRRDEGDARRETKKPSVRRASPSSS